ncbi:hypothetical protein OAO55_02570 [Bacteroidales bacterium]|nr:hypothetical protein [Bacteroidales bacterium]
MLTLQKHVLENVRHDPELFRKELQKSINWLDTDDIINLKNWTLDKFENQHLNIIKEVFADVAA